MAATGLATSGYPKQAEYLRLGAVRSLRGRDGRLLGLGLLLQVGAGLVDARAAAQRRHLRVDAQRLQWRMCS